VAKGRKKKRTTIFGSIRKPTAPPSRKIDEDKPPEKLYPSGRKSKHKQRPEKEENGDVQ